MSTKACRLDLPVFFSDPIGLRRDRGASRISGGTRGSSPPCCQGAGRISRMARRKVRAFVGALDGRRYSDGGLARPVAPVPHPVHAQSPESWSAALEAGRDLIEPAYTPAHRGHAQGIAVLVGGAWSPGEAVIAWGEAALRGISPRLDGRLAPPPVGRREARVHSCLRSGHFPVSSGWREEPKMPPRQS